MTDDKSSRTSSYKEAGVDIDAGNEAVRRLAPLAQATFDGRVLNDIGGFSGLYSLANMPYDEPVLVASTDGVGTKLKVAIMADKHDTIGQDLVAMSVNDILAQGARPLFFLDYLATAKVEPDKIAQIVGGIARACKLANCALIGGETAEMPDLYAPGDYDLAGFAVGIVDRQAIVDGNYITQHHKLIGLASSGLHSNGYSLARGIVFKNAGLKIDSPLLGSTVAEVLLTPTRIYAPSIMAIKKSCKLHGLAHITGGGILENLPRMLPPGCQAVVEKSSFPRPPIFDFLREAGRVEEIEMYRTFNMGLGLIMAVPESEIEGVLNLAEAHGEEAWVIGEIRKAVPGEPRIILA